MTDHNQPTAGWYPDPTERFAERYWDGSGWTARVRDGLVEVVDQQWTLPADPVWSRASGAEESTADRGASGPQPVTTTGGSAPSGGFDRGALLAEVARSRPRPRAEETISAMGGVIALSGLLIFLGWVLTDREYEPIGRPELGLMGVIAWAACYALAISGPRQSRAAGLAGAIVGPLFVVSALFSYGNAGQSAVIGAALVLVVIWGLMFLGPGFTGAPILLGAAVLAAWAALIAIANSTRTDSYYDPYGYDQGWFSNPFDLATSVGIISLIFAFGCVAVAGMADARGAHVLATPLLAVAVIQSAVGIFTSASRGGAGVLAVLVGAAFIVVGAAGQRRGSQWLGAATATIGIGNLIGSITDQPVSAAILALGVGAALVLLAPAINRALAARPSRAPAKVPEDF